MALLSFILLCGMSLPLPNIQAEWPDSVVINEILVSPSQMETTESCTNCHGAVDWNGDGEWSSESDQFIELYNPTANGIDISGWILDGGSSGASPACSIGDGTWLPAGGYKVFFRNRTGIIFDYHKGGAARIFNPEGVLIDEKSFGEKDLFWGEVYTRGVEGLWSTSSDPTPGAEYGSTWALNSTRIGRCYTISETSHSGAYALHGRTVTMISEERVYEEGYVLIDDGEIKAVWDSNEKPSWVNLSGIPIIDTKGTIYPGLIDTHNHIHYNMNPIWDYNLDHRQGAFYTNRYQWGDNPTYGDLISGPKTLIASGSYWDLELESLKYVEMKSIAGGTTSIQGGPTHDNPGYADILARNIEHWNFGRDQMHTKVTEIKHDYSGNHIKSGNNSGGLDAWFLHLCEGVDEKSLKEFEILTDNGLLVGELMIIHGVPLREEHFADMADVGASLVWSPTSNLLLYGETARVDLAYAAGVKISLAPDWSPSGTKSPLHELKTADWWNKNKLQGLFSDWELAKMVTVNPVDEMGWSANIGRIQPGLAADILVLDTIHNDPYRNLIEAIDQHVALTVVGGLPIYGHPGLMETLKGDDLEIIQGPGFTAAIDVTFKGVEKGEQTWAEIDEKLTNAMQFDLEEMYATFASSDGMTLAEFKQWWEGKYPDLDTHLTPIWTTGDGAFFHSLNQSLAFQHQGPIDLYTEYYADPAKPIPATDPSMESLQGQLETAESLRESLEAQIFNAQDQLNSTDPSDQSTIETLQSQITNLTAELANAKSQISSLEKTMELLDESTTTNQTPPTQIEDHGPTTANLSANAEGLPWAEDPTIIGLIAAAMVLISGATCALAIAINRRD